MKISVVIPAHNEGPRIKECLDSLINQTRRADEIIVVDNNSSDNTADVAGKYPEVTVIPEKRAGIIPTRNTGFDAAHGDIIARCDADTILPENFLEGIEQAFVQNPDAVAVSMPATFYDMPVANRFPQLYYLYEFLPRLILGYYTVVGPGMAVRTWAWKKIRNELCTDATQVHEDVDISMHIRKYGTIYHDKNILIKTSGRRAMYNPVSFFGEYTWRFFKMLMYPH